MLNTINYVATTYLTVPLNFMYSLPTLLYQRVKRYISIVLRLMFTIKLSAIIRNRYYI